MPVSVRILEPGLIVVRGLLSSEDEERMAREAQDWGADERNGFFFKDGTPNASAGRGRMYDAAERFPAWVKDVCDRSVIEARKKDPTMPSMEFTHLLVNCYFTRDGVMWHRDCYENDGDSDHPVVNLTLGASCNFGWKHERDDEPKSVILESGDVLLFGGPCRFILHTVYEVLLDKTPSWMSTFERPVRFSFTFRDAPEVRGREEEFKYFKFSEGIMEEQEAFDKVAHDQRTTVKRAYQDARAVARAGA